MAIDRRTPGRRRRTAAVALDAILDAAEAQVMADGPAALRLEKVARAVGVSHPTVLHHVGSREALLKAVVERAIKELQRELVAAIERDPDDVGGMLERVAVVLAAGHGRAMMWLALSGLSPRPSALRVKEMAELTHAVRRGRRGKDTPPFEDTLFLIVLAFAALLAQSVMGPQLLRAAGISDDARAGARFRAWLGRLIMQHLEEG